MLTILSRWIVITLAILLAASLLSGIRVDSLFAAIVAAALLGIVNVIIRPVLILLTLPLTILTLGVFAFVINALLLLLVAYFVSGFHVAGFGWAFLGALIISIANWVANRFIRSRNERPRKRRSDVIELAQGDDGKWR